MHHKGLFTGLTSAWLSSLRTEPCHIYLQPIERGIENVRRWREVRREAAEGGQKGRKEKRKEEMNKSSKGIRGEFIHSSIYPSIYSFNKYILNSYQAPF